MIKILPNDIKMNVCKYLIGSPTNLKLNNNKALKQIQNTYRIKLKVKAIMKLMKTL